jgi:hypothetical protein
MVLLVKEMICVLLVSRNNSKNNYYSPTLIIMEPIDGTARLGKMVVKIPFK